MEWTHPFIRGRVSAMMVVGVTSESKGRVRNADDYMTY
jgi:hypothetical protein